MKRKPDTKRVKIMSGIMAVVLFVFFIRIFDYQLISSSKYTTDNGNIRTRTVVIKAPRGEIHDCYGRPIAINRSGYDVVFNRAYMTSDNMNSTIKLITDVFLSNKAVWNDILPLQNSGEYDFTDDEQEIAILKKNIPVNSYASAQNCFDQLVEKYSLQSYDKQTQRIIMGIRYSMERADFSVANPFTFANDISSQLMSCILEKNLTNQGIDISVVPYREYVDGGTAPHIIGTVGKIEASEWSELKDKGYSYNDYVGKTGVEKIYEDVLKGEDGLITYILDNRGNVISEEITKKPVQGKTVVLSIDKRLQQFVQSTMEENVAYNEEMWNLDIGGMATVVCNVNTGQILACANYPTYTMDQYKYNYDQLLVAPDKPLFDRALNGTYAPGSIMKMAIAAAALENKVTTSVETINCVKKYTRYDDYQPVCLHNHGPLEITHAIGFSCNYFFFEMSYRLGIQKMNQYCRYFGLGENTGIELAEKKGVLAGPEYSESIGEHWTGGTTLAAGIGQQNNAFTPIQMLMYGATIANGGTRYKATILKEIIDPNDNSVVEENKPVVLNTVPMSANTLEMLRQGMRTVVLEGTASGYLKNYKLDTAGKTGTAENSGADNTLYLTFAPYDDAEIAIMVVAEHGAQSTATVPVAKAIIEEYFFNSNDKYEPDLPGELLP
ncbi:MAG: hypothetical protein IKV36_03925 [Clostridia bacterium]|nr:hypothetical protein [Clostridia bacterium]